MNGVKYGSYYSVYKDEIKKSLVVKMVNRYPNGKLRHTCRIVGKHKFNEIVVYPDEVRKYLGTTLEEAQEKHPEYFI